MLYPQIIRPAICAALLSVSIGTLQVARAGPVYLAIDLGASSYASGINANGQVVGVGISGAFITGPHGIGMNQIGGNNDTVVSAVNGSGQVVGWRVDAGGTFRPFFTGPNGLGMTDFGRETLAFDINDQGQVVGIASVAGQVLGGRTSSGPFTRPTSAFITGANGVGMATLGIGTAARGINDSGQVVGTITASDSRPGTTSGEIFITGPNGVGMTNLGTGAGARATDINSRGQVLGYATNQNGSTYAFITGVNGVGSIDLSSLVTSVDGAYVSAANAINDLGQIVGAITLASGAVGHAFVTGPDGVGMTDLNSLVTLTNGAHLFDATAINDHGQIGWSRRRRSNK